MKLKKFYKKAAEVASEGRNNLVYADAMGNLGHHTVEDSGRGHDYHVVEEAIKYYEAGLRVVPDHLSILYNVRVRRSEKSLFKPFQSLKIVLLFLDPKTG